MFRTLPFLLLFAAPALAQNPRVVFETALGEIEVDRARLSVVRGEGP